MKSTSNEGQFRGINRTICIGLGGTGRDVLMRIRRLIVDRYGDLSNLPIVSFVHIDTDKAASQASGLRTGSTYHGVDLSFREAEKVNATMTSTEVTNFVRGLEGRETFDRQGPYAHIGRWFPPQLLRNIKAVEEGAKGIRPVGRLAFFHNYRLLKGAIEAAERRTRGHEASLLKSGLKVDRGLNIFVVCSLCGGTGSGMFLDVAYSLRRDYGDRGAQIVGYLVISPQLYGNAPNMSANSYAALKELNHYTTPGTKFEACYDMRELAIVQEERPPFEYAYLVSHQTSGPYEIFAQSKLCNVIARKISLDFSSELGPVMKGMRDNFLQQLLQWDDHPRPNVQRYLTFGLAAIYFPRDIIVQIALTRISLQLVNFWLNGEGQSPDPQLLLERFLLTWHTDINRRDGFATKLEAAATEGNKNFRSAINAWKNKLERRIADCQNKDDRMALRQQLPREFREQFRKTMAGDTESSRGIWLTRLQQIRPSLTAQLQRDIDGFLATLLTPGNLDFSIKSSRDWLEAIATELNAWQRVLEEQILEQGGTRQLEDLERQWQDAEQIIADIEQKFRPLGKNAQVQGEAKRVLRQVCETIEHNFNLAVKQESLEIVKTLQKQVQTRSKKVAAFSLLVEDLAVEYEQAERNLKQLNFDEMSGEAIFEESDLESCYNILLPSKEFRSHMVQVSGEIPSGRGESLAGAIGGEILTPKQLQKEIDLTVDRLFGSRSTNIMNSAIASFMENYSSATRSTRLGQIIQEAAPLLRLNLSDPYFRNSESKSSTIVGFKDADEQEIKEFKALLRQELGISDAVLKPTQTSSEILIVTEYAGFPLRLIEGLEEMRKPYSRQKNAPGSFVHNDYSSLFADIIPPDAGTMEELEDLFYACLAFDLIQQHPEKLQFQYYDSLRDGYHTAILSPVWHQALEELANREDLIAALRGLLERAIGEIEKQPSRWKGHYLPKLRQFVHQVDNLPESDANYAYRTTVVGIPATTETIAKEGAIDRFRRRLQAQFQSKQKQKPMLTQSPRQVIKGEIMPADERPRTQKQIKTQTAEDGMAKLKQLVQMKKEGYLTDAEFDAAKKRLLGL